MLQIRGGLADTTRQEQRALVRLAALGIVMLAFVAIGPSLFAAKGFPVFVPVMLASGLITIAAARLAPQAPVRPGLLIILGLALAMQLMLLGAPTFLSTDIYRYVWDGRVQAAGINPYIYVPADPALARLRDLAIYPGINRVDYAVTAYPPVAEMFYFLVSRISETVAMMRLGMIFCEAIVVAVIIDLLRRLQRPVTAVVAWAWHPLAIWEIGVGGHVDALMVALLMLGLWLMVRSRKLAAAVFIALAAAVKPYAAIALPVIWRPWDWRTPAAAIAAFALSYLPYRRAGRGVIGFVGSGYLDEEGFASGEGFWLVSLVHAAFGEVPGLKTIYLLAAGAVLAFLISRTVLRAERTPETLIADAGLLLLAGLFVISPHYPWYFLAIVPFLALTPSLATWTLSLTAVLLYRPYIMTFDPLFWRTVAYLPVVIVFAWTLFATHSAQTKIRGTSL